MAKSNDISTSSKGAKCIEIEETPSSGDKFINISSTGDKVIETSVSGGKIIDTIDGEKVIYTSGKDKSPKTPKSHSWIWILVLIVLLVACGGFVGYAIIEEQEQQERIETQRRNEQRQAQEEVERKQRESERREATRKEKEQKAAAQRDAEQRKAREKAQRESDEQAKRIEQQRLTEQRAAQQMQQSSQTYSNSENNKRHYSGHVAFTTKDGYTMRWEYDGYYTEEEFRELERQFYQRAGLGIQNQ